MSARSGSSAIATISGKVTVPSSRSVPRALPVRSTGPEMSSTSSSIWKARPIRCPKFSIASDCSGAHRRPSEHAGGGEKPAGLESATLEVVLFRQRHSRRRHAAASAHPGPGRPRCRSAPRSPQSSPALGQQPEGGREEPVAEGSRPFPAGLGEDGRPSTPQRSPVEHVVVDQAGHVDHLDRDRRQRTAASAPSGPAQSRTSIGRMRLPPAFRVATASGVRGPSPSTASCRPCSTSLRPRAASYRRSRILP